MHFSIRCFFLTFFILFPLFLFAEGDSPETSFFQKFDFDFFPVPIFETRPDEGETFGVMPVLLLSKKDTKAISAILAVIGQYNSITKFSGGLNFIYYPEPEKRPNHEFEFYFEWAEKFARETLLRYLNPRWRERFFIETQFQWLKTPFGRFFDFGAQSVETAESNFVAEHIFGEATLGYFLTQNFRVNVTEKIQTTDISTQAITDLADTLTLYGGQPGISDATQWWQALSATFDTRPLGEDSQYGFLIEGRYFFSLKALGSDFSFHGFSIESIFLKPFFKNKTVTALRVAIDDHYGSNIPFYWQSSLGGPDELRSYIPDRFVDKGRWILTWEQRVQIFRWQIFGIPVEFWADPFVEVGRVFANLDHFGLDHTQFVGGLGLRAIVPPNVVGRLDFAVGREGYNIYTMLGFPF